MSNNFSDLSQDEREAMVDAFKNRPGTRPSFIAQLKHDDEDVVVENGIAYFVIPREMNRSFIKRIHYRVITAGTGTDTIFRLYDVDGAQTIATTTLTAGNSSVDEILGGNVKLDNHVLMRFDVTQASTTPALGLVIEVEIHK